MDYQLACAKAFLIDILLFEAFRPWQPVKVLLKVGRQQGISRALLKQARKELGVVSMTINGEQFWAHPRRIELPGVEARGMQR